MSLNSEQEKMWFESKEIPGTKFKLNDPVIVTKGEFMNRVGSVLSLEEIANDPVYCVELEDGETVEILESLLLKP